MVVWKYKPNTPLTAVFTNMWVSIIVLVVGSLVCSSSVPKSNHGIIYICCIGFNFDVIASRAAVKEGKPLGKFRLFLLVFCALQTTHFIIYIYIYTLFLWFSQFLFFFLWLSTIIFIYFFNEDVEVNELEDLHSRSHEVDGQYYFFIISAKIKSWNYLYLLYWFQFWCYSLRKMGPRIC